MLLKDLIWNYEIIHHIYFTSEVFVNAQWLDATKVKPGCIKVVA